MKFVNYSHNLIFDLDEGESGLLIIENSLEYANLIGELWNQYNGEDGEFIFTSNTKEYSISKNIEIVFNPFTIDLNSKKIINSFYNRISKYGEELVEEKNEIIKLAMNILDSISNEVAYNSLEYEMNFEWSSFFKLFGYRFCNNNSIVANIIEYVKLLSEFSDVKVLVFVAIYAYINDNQLEEIIKTMQCYKINGIFIENSDACELYIKKMIIDKDLCII